MNETYQNRPAISGNVKVKWQQVKRGGGFGLEAPYAYLFEGDSFCCGWLQGKLVT